MNIILKFIMLATKTAMDDIGLKIVANIVMVGAITKITEVISKDAAIESIKASVPAGTKDKNIQLLLKQDIISN